ncbi:hypothetical protein A3I99_00110 [Candidatus Kaiserbacteria bacterium RIFCSPLOWO2_02_FULL_45_11b]|uniref:UPF0145 protein A3G90_02720 n=1 Tax=Candidatus Kaiserbacteria bacterium RIFCSPLOWO2_12_FULL_45_26 TaxID=1798525 RepID=A0A1F6FHR5_9BACT|nr:MAG: hypothetical protein A2Z56_02970 [Candidatus Kaiserbacteria bacterium RIFCSPHIGHO2_12_45_16]OGG71105.1 MAG: hypothetical protein A2929_01730 [Candidatus Kaiserbacteria bacterium RIFCSPLOWO2_01_FULL_45_25]OGG84327.1 MAG: hypothetical protein A3I99_00110 [Candidatus Kaiserbacteria bacterium RIFCSPLOWO2_02_FULL_45_11b]OGG85405.1 MAG: hypothetical protein A3G90_02720 [Candidatus Kaiserbacteria bacterium RIFCSPLOWO2_12_FULL_45_26]
MLITTTENVAGREVAVVLGLVKGSTVRTRHVGSDIMAGLRSLIGGEVKGYVIALNDARTEATGRMLVEAEAMGADAILCTRYTTSQVMAGAAEILAYGTAVKFR